MNGTNVLHPHHSDRTTVFIEMTQVLLAEESRALSFGTTRTEWFNNEPRLSFLAIEPRIMHVIFARTMLL